MNIFQLYRLVARNQRLATRRHPMFSKGKFMKIFIYLTVAFWAAYLIFFGVLFGTVLKEDSIEPYDRINGGMLFFLIVDFFARFMAQETPAQEIKPYKLLPIPQKSLINIFLVRMGLQLYNLMWFFFLVPFGILCIPEDWGFMGFIGFLLGWWLMFVINAYWYLLWRTLINRKSVFFLIPLVIYAVLVYFGYLHDMNNQWLFYATLFLGRGFIQWKWWSFLSIIAIAVVMFFVNQRIQLASIYREISRETTAMKVKTQKMTFLDRYGVIGEYLRLEIKSIRRNKVVRSQFYIGIFYTLLLCLLLAFTNIYDNAFMTVFILIYCFACLGTITLTNIMCSEGNYMDLLMSRRESALALLKAKYFFNCIMLILPFLISLIPVFQHKFTLLDIAGSMFFTSGCIFPFLFQLTVYNNTTIDLNNKVTGKNNMRGSKTQVIMSFAALFLPMFIMYGLVVAFGDNKVGAPLVMLILGLVGTALHPLWLRNIYKRFLARRYENMEGFRSTRKS